MLALGHHIFLPSEIEPAYWLFLCSALRLGSLHVSQVDGKIEPDGYKGFESLHPLMEGFA